LAVVLGCSAGTTARRNGGASRRRRRVRGSGGQEEAGAGHRERDEQAGPFVAVAEMGGDAGGVNENDQRKNMSAKRMAEKRARILVAMLRPAAMRARPVR
jgi:hypothetical protein